MQQAIISIPNQAAGMYSTLGGSLSIAMAQGFKHMPRGAGEVWSAAFMRGLETPTKKLRLFYAVSRCLAALLVDLRSTIFLSEILCRFFRKCHHERIERSTSKVREREESALAAASVESAAPAVSLWTPPRHSKKSNSTTIFSAL